MIYLFIGVGGALGACLRWLIMSKCEVWFGKGMPFGTLIVNVSGSFLLGVFFALVEQGTLAESPYKSLFSIGLLGAFTTFSTFSLDTLLLLQQGDWFKAFANVLLNVFLCILAAGLAVHLFKG